MTLYAIIRALDTAVGVDPRHPFGNGAQKLIRDCSGPSGQFIQIGIWTENFNEAVYIDVRKICKINHAHIHTYPAALRRHAAVGVKRTIIGKASHKAVGVSNGKNTHPGAALRFKYAAVAYASAGVINFYRTYVSHKAHTRAQTQPAAVAITIE